MPVKEDGSMPTLDEAFDMIDADGSGALDAEEGFDALYCMVHWGLISEEEAFAVYDHAESHAGEDGEVDMGEMGDAMEEYENATDGEIAAAVDGANMTTE
jgi:Ca2+-binding EF-hand superfamily protein